MKVGVAVLTVLSSAELVVIPVIVTLVPDIVMLFFVAITFEPSLTRILAPVLEADGLTPSLANIVGIAPLPYATG